MSFWFDALKLKSSEIILLSGQCKNLTVQDPSQFWQKIHFHIIYKRNKNGTEQHFLFLLLSALSLILMSVSFFVPVDAPYGESLVALPSTSLNSSSSSYTESSTKVNTHGFSVSPRESKIRGIKPFHMYIADIGIHWKAMKYNGALKFVNCLEVPVFLHKYDPKHQQIFKQVLKVHQPNLFI